MKLEKFEQAKIIKEDLDKLERQKRKLESALESCSLNVTIEFSPSRAFLTRKDEVSIYTKDLIKELVSKELEMLNHQIEFKKEKFENV
jgi:hypothetical protein